MTDILSNHNLNIDMTIFSFALISVVVLLLLLVAEFVIVRMLHNSSRDFLQSHRTMLLLYPLVFIGLAVLAVFTVKSYLYPKDEKVFRNIDYHVLEHKGFAFDSVLYLVSDGGGVSQDAAFEQGLWDTKSGLFMLTHDSLVIQNYYEPVFCCFDVEGSSCEFQLLNPIITDNIEQKGLKLSVGGNTLTMKMEDYKSGGILHKKEKCRYICTYNNSAPDTSTFEQRINRGYPLNEIVSRCRNLEISEEMLTMLEGALLVRETLNATSSGAARGNHNTSKLLFMPGGILYDGADVTVNDKAIATFDCNRRFTKGFTSEVRLFSGIGRFQSDVYRVVPQQQKHVELLYVLPKMQKLRPRDGQLFMTSSTDVAASTVLDGGYFYNIFDNGKNANHISAQMRYFVGSARDSMYFEVCDLYKDAEKTLVAANEDFALSPRLKLGNRMQWLFRVEDMRATNPLQWEAFMVFIFVFLGLVMLRLFTDFYFDGRCRWCAPRTSTLSFTELAMYIVVFCFGVVRLVLAWRMSTFVPIEDAGAESFAILRNGMGPWHSTFWPICALPVLVMLYAFFKDSINEFFSTFAYETPFRKRSWGGYGIMVLYAAVLAGCYVAGKILLPVAFNIAVPVALYFLFAWWMSVVEDEMDCDGGISFPQVLMWFLLVGYLAMKDSGYAVIFVLCYALYYLIICQLIKSMAQATSVRRHIITKIAAVLLFSTMFFFIVKYEGLLIILMLNHLSLFVCIASAAIVCDLCWHLFWKNKEFGISKLKRVLEWVALAVTALVLIESVLDLTHCNDWLTQIANDKGHMKYRAKVQQLKPNERIDDLLMANDLHSSDVTFIMRSAHNQWFINQYADRYDEKGTYMQLQPHFRQGSSYTTQTTDLVVTRYVLAEHGRKGLFCLVSTLLLLLLIFCVENNFERNKGGKILLMSLLLLYTTALFVYLSATNRIVFIGQDFPFLSITSRIAVFFPVALFLLVLLPIISNEDDSGDDSDVKIYKDFIPVVMIALTLLCVYAIPPMGRAEAAEGENRQQHEAAIDDQFDVSKLIESISAKVRPIDAELVEFQNDFPQLSKVGVDSLWHAFLIEYAAPSAGGDQPTALYRAKTDSTENNRFFHTLLFDYFSNEQPHKDNPEELIHLRRRNGIYRLCVNKKHYSITSVMHDDIQWKGEILSAEVALDFGFVDVKSPNSKKISFSNQDYIENVLDYSLSRQYREKVPNITISWFDTSWTDKPEPLLLIRSRVGKGTKEFFCIDNSDANSVMGSARNNQVATRILVNDIVTLNIRENGKDRNLLTWTYGKDNEHYIARNLWMNGRRQLFYPLGKESMWSYNFANLVSGVYGKDEALRDSTIRISIDYELHKTVYNLINGENRSAHNLDERTVEQLMKFREAGFESQVSQRQNSRFYFDRKQHRLVCLNRRYGRVVDAINQIFRRIKRAEPAKRDDVALNEAIDRIVERSFSYSAVVLDGNGRIRLLFDYEKRRKVDPNNIRYLNRFMSEMYKDGSIASERDIFGNKALSLLIPGPGSSFKPIAYTAVTSQQNIGWESLQYGAIPAEVDCLDLEYYGGVSRKEAHDKKWTLENYGGNAANNYIVRSDNLYHSLVIMFGNQRVGEMLNILKPAGRGAENFPTVRLGGTDYSFDRDKWYDGGTAIMHNQSCLSLGLTTNFRLNTANMQVGGNEYDVRYFGPAFANLNKGNAALRGWSLAESGSLNTADKHSIKKGLMQMSLGANPLEVSPLQMAEMGMRLTTLNRFEYLTTLSDTVSQPAGYQFFELPSNSGWTDDSYLRFHRSIIFKQMRDNFRTGTAKALSREVAAWEKLGYYFYAKTGTLNITDKGSTRLKHLMVIISNKPLENITTQEELQSVKYYVIYMSYLGIDKTEFNMQNFGKVIGAVVQSELFNKYMKE